MNAFAFHDCMTSADQVESVEFNGKQKVREESGFFSPVLYYPLEGLRTAFKPQIKKISQSQLVL